ncbi:YeiH family protein [Anaerocolumna sp. MB42-C2]|uniref:YeiH family protein n=1 Tax=Anaerocolumna sp. MB42-C2 TaxID=3070997 RepID=UPI0027E00D1E|nr:YeiH family protein [Anaerocolumna sp. MB42-C2]WMJ87966.1 YeiH family protein [Anaerocolumna sp. MB42-C2]
MNILRKKIPGIILAFIIAIPAWLIGNEFLVIGSPVLGILLGILLSALKRPFIFEDGIKFTSKKILQYSIILLGFDMNLYQVLSTGKETLILLFFTLTTTFIIAYIAGRSLNIDPNTNILIGIGSAICGGSAIAATAPVIKAKDEEIAQAISTIFLFNVIAAFLFPFIGHVMNMNDHNFGLWAGTAINDTSSVVAAGYTYSNAAGSLAVIVKLTRTLIIVPVTLFLALYTSKKNLENSRTEYNIINIFPWFVIGFILASILSTFSPIPAEFNYLMTKIGKYLIVMAMASIGLNTNIVKLVKNGVRPILLGLICWVSLAIVSLAVQYLILK